MHPKTHDWCTKSSLAKNPNLRRSHNPIFNQRNPTTTNEQSQSHTKTMKLTTLYHLTALLGAAPGARAGLRAKAGRGKAKPAGDDGAPNPDAVAGGGRGGGRGGGGKQHAGGGSGTTAAGVLVEMTYDKASGKTLAERCADAAAAAGATVATVYGTALHGCLLSVPAGAAAVASTVTTLSSRPGVATAEEDGKVYTTQAPYSWGLDRVDQCALPLSGAGTLTQVDATGVRVYILDTGIDKDHNEFAGMIAAGDVCHINTAGSGSGPFDDGNGHG